jgi:hypothetical protein
MNVEMVTKILISIAVIKIKKAGPLSPARRETPELHPSAHRGNAGYLK